ncbi:DNA-dependent ATPase fun30 [Neophaeococcomyces mojaviensis]|uniref:DNA-dependent ATPase fun30 n=1 Tax=Neophaeococcomyces mojaviensis TaxID=3383035 RepID=A0ACC3A8G8_9EURO|nr:DNA-dependent ATPase fun30 [Knufia sp. JES_112]
MDSSPALSAQSDDDLFPALRRPTGYETIETLPVQHLTIPTQHLTRIRDSPELESDTLKPIGQSQLGLPPLRRPESPSQHITQPTQLIERSPVTEISSPPPAIPVVQVAASSPMAAAVPRRPNGILANAIAPPGTTFRRPIPPVEKPKAGAWPALDDDSSESDREERERHSIKRKTFERKAPPGPPQPVKQGQADPEQYEKNLRAIQRQGEQERLNPRPKPIPQPVQQGQADPVQFQKNLQQIQEQKQREQLHDFGSRVPAAPNSFTDIINKSFYEPLRSQAIKRSADTMANSYGSVFKKPRQNAPSRAMPVISPQTQPQQPWEPTELNDITDPSMRKKTSRLHATLPNHTIAECWHALVLKNGQYDDAVDHVLLMSEKRDAQKPQVMDLTGSEDELMPTPATKKQKSHVLTTTQASQTARKPAVSIAKKWADIAPAPPKHVLNVFDTPPPQEPAVKKRTLMRGRRNRSPSPTTRTERDRGAIVIQDESEDDADSGVHSGRDDGSLQARVFKFFNECTPLDLTDISGVTKDIAEHMLSSRPFRNVQAIMSIQNPNKKGKSRAAISLGEKTWDKVYEMTSAYQAVDMIVQQCEEMARPVARSMSKWGVDVHGKSQSGHTGLDFTNIQQMTGNSQRSNSSHDSGIGTPVSDDGDPKTRKGFIPQPASLNEGVKMKDYQVVGLNWLYLLFKHELNAILADDMGLGKTLQTIAFIAHLAEIGEPGPHLIVVPSATLENWLKEFNRFAPGLIVKPYYGSIPEREEMRMQYEADRDTKQVNVLVTTYVIAKAKEDSKWLKYFGFTCTIYDEGHQLKNPTSEVASKLTKIRSRFRLLLTGTPLQNNLNELMGLLKFLMPDVFEQRENDLQAIFKQQVSTITEDTSSRQMLLSKQRIERARSMLTPFILRRKKWQVLKDLPKKERKVEYCDMTPEQQEIYNLWIAKVWDVRDRKLRGERVPADESANVLVRLRQAAIHPLLFRYFYKDKTLRKIAKTCPKIDMFRESNPEFIMKELVEYADFETHNLCSKHELLYPYMLDDDRWEVSGKVQALLRLLANFRKEGHRTLVFSQFVMVLDILERVLTSQEIKYLRLDGSTKVDERQDLIDEFNAEDSETPVFMLSTKAGGAGINLASASRVIVFDSGFNPQDDVQAENRAHRIGQTKDVEVWRLITRGTVEEQIYDMGLVKLKLDQEVAGEALDGPAIAAEVTAEEQQDGKKGKKDVSGGLSKTEQEGAKVVEDLLFKKLEANGPKSPATVKVEAPTSKKEESTTSKKGMKLKLNLKKEVDPGPDSPLDSPLTELSSSDEEADENNPPVKKEKENDDIGLPDRPKRGAAKRVSQKSLSQKSIKEEESSQRSRSGRLVRGRR